MHIYEFSKKFDVAIKDIVELLKERGVRRADAEFVLSESHISFLKKRFHVGETKESVSTVRVDVNILDKEMSLGDLAQQLGRPASELIVLLLKRGIVANRYCSRRRRCCCVRYDQASNLVHGIRRWCQTRQRCRAVVSP